MTATKPWWQSRGVWGALVAIGASIVGGVPVADQESAVDMIVTIATGVGGLVALGGRVAAKKGLT